MKEQGKQELKLILLINERMVKMFLNLQKFCKQMKKAYNDGRLDIGYVEDGLFICSGYWMVWIDSDYIPNKIKAMVVELAGELPDWDTLFTISKAAPEKQIKLLDSSYRWLIEGRKDAVNKLIKTSLVISKHYDIELFQNLMGEITGIKSEYTSFIDHGEADYSIESAPTGPAYRYSIDGGIYWYNDFGTVVLYPYKIPKDDPLTEALSLIQWKEDGKIEKRYTFKKEKIEQPESRYADYEQSEIPEENSEGEAGEGD